jgi:hypothetical protein
MARSLVSLVIDELILHEVPKARRHDPDAAPLVYSDLPTSMTGDQRRYLQERLVKALSKDARHVIEDAEASSPVPDLVRALLIDPSANFVDPSREMASQLRVVQVGQSPAGLFLLARCTWGGQPAVLVAKVELE